MKNNIKKYRERLGISQERLAKMIDVRRETLGRFETGKGTPNLKTALKISYLLEVDIEKLWPYDVSEEINDKLIIKDVKPFKKIRVNKNPETVFQSNTYCSPTVSEMNSSSQLSKTSNTSSTDSSVLFNDGFKTSNHGNNLYIKNKKGGSR